MTNDAKTPNNACQPPIVEPSGKGVVVTALAEMPDKALLDETALAQALGVSKRTIRRMVGRFELPPPVKFAGRSMWQAGKVLAYFEEAAERVSREAERRAKEFRQI